MENDLISVVVRFHDVGQIGLLSEALVSLAKQEYRPIEVWIVTQSLDADALKKIEAGLPSGLTARVSNVEFAANQDGRTRLLNQGLGLCRGRYLAFLDYDDVVYADGYRRLIRVLQDGPVAVAVGGCRVVVRNGTTFEEAGNPFSWGRNRLDLFRDNFIPFHSIVIDRKKIAAEELRFDESIVRCEDYELLLRLAARYEFDFTNHGTPVCEYRMRRDGTTIIDQASRERDAANVRKWEEAIRTLQQRKRTLLVSTSGAEIEKLVSELADLRGRRSFPERLMRGFARRVLGRKFS